MTARTCKKLYYLYCFMLGFAALPIGFGFAVLFRLPLHNDEQLGGCLFLTLALLFVAGASPLFRLKVFRQHYWYWPQGLWLIGGLFGYVMLGLFVQGLVILPLSEILLARTRKPEIWVALLLALPLALCVVKIDITLIEIFEGKTKIDP